MRPIAYVTAGALFLCCILSGSALAGGDPGLTIDGRVHAKDGTVTLHATLRAGNARSPYELVLPLRILRIRERTRVRLGHAWLRTGRLVWRGTGGEVILSTPPGRAPRMLVVQGITLESRAGRVLAWGRKGAVHVEGERLDLGQLAHALGRPMPEGLLSFHARLGGWPSSLAATAEGRVELAVRSTAPWQTARLGATIHAGRLRAWASVSDGETAEVRVVGDAPRTPRELRRWRLLAAEGHWRGVPLHRVGPLLGLPSAVDGMIDGKATFQGGRLQVALHVRRVRNGTLRDIEIDLRATATARASSFKARMWLGDVPLGTAEATLGVGLANVRNLRARAPLVGRLVIDDFPLEGFPRALALAPSDEGVVRAHATLGGSLGHPTVHGTAEVRQRSGGSLEAEVRVGRASLDVSIQAQRLNLADVGAFARHHGMLAEVAGTLDAKLHVSGSRSAPTATGLLHVDHGTFRLGGRGPRLAGVVLDIDLPRRALARIALTGRAGSGSLRARGQVLVVGLVPRQFVATLETLRVPIDLGTRAVAADLTARLTGHREDHAWYLMADVRPGVLWLPHEQGRALQRVRRFADVTFVDARGLRGREAERAKRAKVELLARLHLVAPALRVRGAEIDALVHTDLFVSLARSGITVNGEAHAKSGHAKILGQRYEIDRARVLFLSASLRDPELDIRVTRDLVSALLWVEVAGSLRAPKVAVGSQPPIYDEAQVLGLLLGGRADEPAMARRSFEERAVGLASGWLVGRVRERLAHVLPVDVLRLELEPFGPPSPRVEVGKWLSGDLYVAYRYRSGVTEVENANEVALEFRIGRRWLVSAVYGDHGMGATDLVWTRRY